MLKFGIHDFINAQPLRDALKTMGEWTKIEMHTNTPAHLADQLVGKVSGSICVHLYLRPFTHSFQGIAQGLRIDEIVNAKF